MDIVFEDGIYYLPGTVQFTGQDSKDYPATVTLRARHEGKAVISGGQQIRLDWNRSREHLRRQCAAGMDIVPAVCSWFETADGKVPECAARQATECLRHLVLDHQAQPNPEMDPLQPERIALWKNPESCLLCVIRKKWL